MDQSKCVHAGATHLIGFSDGGEVALLIAAATPASARSVVTWGAAGAISDEQRPNLAMLGDIVDNPADGLQGFSGYLKEAYGEANARAMIQSFVADAGAIIDSGGDISLSRAGDITCPVLLIVGEDDDMAPRALVSQLASHIRAVEVIEVAGVGHGVYDERPEWLTQTIRDWLEQHSRQVA